MQPDKGWHHRHFRRSGWRNAMLYLKLFEVSVAQFNEPNVIGRTWLVLAKSRDEACRLVPGHERIIRVKCNEDSVHTKGQGRIIGWRSRSLLDGVAAYASLDHPRAGPHPTD
jgi:hypothetical protein